MGYFISDEREWRVSKSGFSIRTGWADDKRIIAAYPGIAHGPGFDAAQFQEWLDTAEHICKLYNASLPPPTPTPEAGE